MPSSDAGTNATAPAPAGPGGPPLDLSKLPHDSLQANIVFAVVICWMISLGAVVARFYTRRVIVRVVGATDWCILAACLLSLGVSISIIMEVQFGMGAHVWDIPMTLNPVGIVESEWISIVLYALSLTMTKVSIILLYVTLFTHSWVEKASWATLGLVVVTNIYMLYVIFTACIPLQAFWDTSIPGNCHSQAWWLSNQYTHIASDILILLLPIPVVWQLQVRWRQKLVLLGIFAMGFFVVFLSIARITILQPVLANPGMDFTYNTTQVFYWTVVETNAAIVCACAMTLRPLLSRWWPKLFSPHPYASQRDSPRANDAPPTIGQLPSRQTAASKSFGSAGDKTLAASSSWTTTVTSKNDEEKMINRLDV